MVYNIKNICKVNKKYNILRLTYNGFGVHIKFNKN